MGNVKLNTVDSILQDSQGDRWVTLRLRGGGRYIQQESGRMNNEEKYEFANCGGQARSDRTKRTSASDWPVNRDGDASLSEKMIC